MKKRRFKSNLITFLILGGLLPAIGSIFLHLSLSDNHWIRESLHSIVEALGSFIALSLAVLILLLRKDKRIPSYYIWVSCALIGMGILDMFHAFTSPGNSFVLLHSMAVLVGGLLFAMVWLPDSIAQSRSPGSLLTAAAGTTIIFGVLAVGFPDTLPAMISQGAFTPAAKAINILGGLSFLSAAVYFIILYRSGQRLEDFLFTNLCLLNGWAGLLFQFSQMWYVDWWFWHLLRLIAYLTIISYMFITFQRAGEELRQHHEHMEEANKALQAEVIKRRQTEKELDQFFNLSLDMFSITGFDGYFRRLNMAWEKTLGFTNDELQAGPFIEFVHPDDRKTTIAELQKLKAGTATVHFENRYMCKDGRFRWLAWASKPIAEENLIYAVARDITEQKCAGEVLQKERDKAQKYLDIAECIIAVIDANQKVSLINKKGCEILGFKEQEIIGKNWFDTFIPERIGGEIRTVFTKLMAGDIEPVKYFENAVLTRNDEERIIAWRNTVLRDDTGNTIGILSAGEDITERKHAEEDVLKLLEELRTIFDNIPVGIAYLDRDFKFLRVNKFMCSLTGLSQEDLIGRLCYETVGEYVDSTREGLEKICSFCKKDECFKTRRPTVIERPLGNSITKVITIPKLDKDGNISHFLEVIEDITERKRSEAALRESEERYRKLVEFSPDAIAIHSEGKIVFANLAGAKLLGATDPGQIIGKTLLDVVHPDYQEIVQERLQRMREEGKDVPRVEEKLIRLDGSIIDVEVASTPFNHQGKHGTQVIVRDITERKRAEETLYESEMRYRTLFDRSIDGILIIDPETAATIEFNEAAHRQLGYTHEEFKRLQIFDYEAIEKPEETRARIEEILREGRDDFETRHRTKDGRLRDIMVTVQAIKLSDRVSLYCIFRDITERKRAEEELRKSEKRFRQIAESADEWIWEVDADGLYTYSSPVIEKILGYKPQEIAGKKHFYDLFVPDVREELKKEAFETFARKESFRGFINPNMHKNGNIVILETSGLPILDERGNLLGYRGVDTDITERMRAEEALLESEHSYRTLSKNLPGIVYRAFLRENNRMQFFNNMVQPMTGFMAEELVSGDICSLDPLILAEDRAYVITTVKCAIADNQPFQIEYRLRHKDGGIRYFIERGRPIYGADGEPLYIDGVIFDITERKQAEEQIQEQAALLDKARDAIAVRDLEHRIIHWNKGAERLYGWTKEEATGKNANELLYIEESPSLVEARRSVIERGEWTGELRQRTKGGKDIIIESRWTLVHDGGGKPKSILIINTDITEKKKLEAQLLRAQRLESIGTLASGIAHDINNVLLPIMLSLQLLQERFTDDESLKLLDILERSTQRGASLIKQVQSFARGVEGERIALQVTHIISEIRKIITETFPRSIEIRTDIFRDLWTVTGDATQLHQVLMNLCVNARDAMPDGGILSISAENVLIDENYAKMNIDIKTGQYAVITVSDTGAGIPPEVMDRIFEPFFTTKEHGKGTGLGLSTALTIVKSHGGFMNVYSEVGKGTVFKIYLPAVKTTAVQQVEEHIRLPTGRGELILVVDDEAHVCEITRSILEKHGYRVLTASDGEEAIALYTQNKERIKIVLIDMMMPIMEGPESIRELRKINPEVKIIAISGLVERNRLSKVAVTHIHAFLAKPFTAERLLRAVHEVINTK